MTATVWLLVSGALAVWPGRRADGGHRASRDPVDGAAAPIGADSGRAAAARRDRALSVGAVIALAVASVGIFGADVGLVVAVVASPLLIAGLAWLRRHPRPIEPDRTVALALDLAAAVLRSGRPVPDALLLAAPVARADVAEALVRTARLLALGAEPRSAWSGGDGIESRRTAELLSPVVEVAVRSQSSGARLADAFGRLAGDLRAERSAAALARANKAGVQAMAPLAACFLPSFVCLGIVPVIAGVASTVLTTLS